MINVNYIVIKRKRERLIASCGELVSTGFDLFCCGTPTATLASEIQPAEKGRITSLSILCLILSLVLKID
jgi:hypothetical protein